MSLTPTPLTAYETIARLEVIYETRPVLGFDSEGTNWPTCLGFATTATNVLVVDTLTLKGKECAKPIWALLQAILESPAITKVCWAAGHEREFLQWTLGWRLRNFEDAMMAFHERWPELPKGLKYAASILTRLPCWTTGISWSEDDDRPAASGVPLFTYNAHDCAATLQLWEHKQLAFAHAATLSARGERGESPGVTAHREARGITPLAASLTTNATPYAITTPYTRYLANLALIEPFNYASQRGVLYDHAAAEAIRARLTPKLWEAQARVDAAAGIVIPLAEELVAYAREHCCAKRKRTEVSDFATAQTHALKAYGDPIRRVREIVAAGDCSAAALGEIGALLDIGLNVKSTPAVTATLNRLGLPAIFKRGSRKASVDSDDATASAPTQTKDAVALLTLFLRTGHPITTAILETVALRGRLQELDRGVDSDGRIRSSYTICGPSTDRTASHSWLTGSGGNVQTVPREPENFRVCYVADAGHLWFKLDLTGADLWTVAARVAECGDRTMLDDLLAGIRIPSLVGLLMEGYRAGSDRSVIKADCLAYRARLKASGESWKDTVWKKASHLTNYGGKPARIRQSVIEDTYAETGTPIDPGAALCAQVQRLYLARYWGVSKWWSRVASTVVRTGKLVYATGREREFLSRRPRAGALDDATKREALASEPQHNTTHVIKTGINRLWHDLSNWPSGAIGEGDPIAQPTIPNVHDEANLQARNEDRPYVTRKLHEWFDVELTIGRERIVIPWDAGVGTNWGNAKEPL